MWSKVVTWLSELAPTAVDPETGEVLNITAEMRSEALANDEFIQIHYNRAGYHLHELGLVLATMRNQRLYLALGFRTLGDYCETQLGHSREWADRRIRTALALGVSATTLWQIPKMSQAKAERLALLDDGERMAFIERHPVADMTTRQLDAAVAKLKAQNEVAQRQIAFERERGEAMEHRVLQAEGKVKELEQRPPEVVEKAVPDPQVQAENERLQKRLADAERELKQLESKANADGLLDEKIRQKQREIKALAEQQRRMGPDYHDGGRDPEGGQKLAEAVAPIDEVVLRVLSKVKVLKSAGVGGPCNDDRIQELSEQLRDLAAVLDSILHDRSRRPINAEYRVVE